MATGAGDAYVLRHGEGRSIDLGIFSMTVKATAANTKPVTIKGKNWYCCAGCNMTAIADKPAAGVLMTFHPVGHDEGNAVRIFPSGVADFTREAGIPR